MSKFIVLKVLQDYDYVEGVENYGVFNSYQEAQDFIEKIREESRSKHKKRMEYIDKFVDNFIVPMNLDYQGWQNYLKQFKNWYTNYVTPYNFKEQLKNQLKSFNIYMVFEDNLFYKYDPPEFGKDCSNLFSLEV